MHKVENNKFTELNKLNLNGYTCYMKQPTTKGRFVYSFSKKYNNGFLNVVALYENIEFQLQNNLSDSCKFKIIEK